MGLVEPKSSSNISRSGSGSVAAFQVAGVTVALSFNFQISTLTRRASSSLAPLFAGMPSLPLELIRQIVEDLVDFGNWPLSYSHLATVSLSCRLLRFEAQRLLFRSPGELFTHNAKRKQTTLFLDTIVSSPERLALLVEYFIIIFDDWFEPDSDETAALIQQLANALQAMHNLTLLEVYQWKGTIPPLPNILRNTHFKLTHFVWSGYARTEFDDMNFLANFLRHQDKIEHLHMAGFINEDTLKKIASDILPCLRSLSAPYSFTEIFLPEKEHVTSLRWVGFGDDFNTPLPRPGTAFPCQLETISKELGRIRYLSYDSTKSCFPVGPGLQQISSLLTSLICLDTRRGDIKVRLMHVIKNIHTSSL